MTFRFRNFDRLGLVERLRLAKFDQLLARDSEPEKMVSAYGKMLRTLTSLCSAVALDHLEKALQFVEVRSVREILNDWTLLGALARSHLDQEIQIQEELDRVLATYNPVLLRVFADEFSHRMPLETERENPAFGPMPTPRVAISDR